MNESTIIPPEVFDELLALRDKVAVESWHIGDLAAHIIDFNESTGSGATKTEIHKAIGSVLGKASRTIREYIAVSQFWSGADREAYDLLSYDHFRVAMKHDNPRGSLDWALERVGETGKPATVDEMVANFRENPEKEEPGVDKFIQMVSKIRNGILDLGEQVPGGTAREIDGVLNDLDRLLRGLAETLDKPKIKVEVKQLK
jgi:hypothetical protein